MNHNKKFYVKLMMCVFTLFVIFSLTDINNTYAKQKKLKYTVTFDGNGATKGYMDSIEKCVGGKEYTVEKNTFYKRGYKFSGWSTQSDGEVICLDGGTIKFSPKTNNENIVLYAIWKPINYKIVYNLKGGKNSKKNPATYTVVDKNIKLKMPVRKGYIFKGWYKDKKFKIKNRVIKSGSIGKKVFYAKWQKVTYYIDYVTYGGKNNINNPDRFCVNSKKIKLHKPTKQGAEFLGWYSDPEFKNKITSIPKGTTGNITLYAKWDSVDYVSTLVDIAISQVGYKAGANQDNKFALYFDERHEEFYNAKKNHFDWCDIFVDWCMTQAFGADKAMELLNQPHNSLGAGCRYSKDYYKKINRFYTTPKVGDQIIFDWDMDINDGDHTGIVVKVTKKYVTTVEGNTGGGDGQVAMKKYKRTDPCIIGYGRPIFKNANKEIKVVIKSNEELANEVIYGMWGNKDTVIKRELEAEGYNYEEVMEIVDTISQE